MYSRFQLQNDCASRTSFENGLASCRDNKINKIKATRKIIDNTTEAVEIKSTVTGDHDIYSVRIIIDEKDGQDGTGKLMLDYCSCPGNSNKGEFCKHCIATIIKYLDMRDQGIAFTEQQGDPDDEIQEEMSSQSEEKTTPKFLEVMKSGNSRRRLSISQKSRKGTFRIVPYITISDVSADVEFRAGRDRLYIIRDIGQFVKAVKENLVYQYGRNLEFTHSEELFDEPSQRIIDFMNRYELNKKTHTLSYQHRSDNIYRFVTLKNGALDAFFTAVENTDVPAAASLSSGTEEEAQETTHYHVKRETPEINIKVQGTPSGGAKISGNFPKVLMGVDNYILIYGKTIYLVSSSSMPDMKLFFEYIAEEENNEITIGAEDITLFASEMLQVLKKYCNVEFVDFDETQYMPEEARFKIYIDAPKKDIVTCGLFAEYGKVNVHSYNVYADHDYVGSERDESAEMEAKVELKKYFSKYDPKKKLAVMANNDTMLYEFLTEGIFSLNSIGEVFISDNIKSIKVKKSPRITAGVSLDGNLLNFSLSSEDFTPAQLAEILHKYDRKKKFFRLKDGTFINVSSGLENIVNIDRALHLTEAQLASGKVVVPKYRALFLDSELMDSSDVVANRSREFRALIRNMKTVEDNDYEVPAKLKGILRHYQKYGFRWLKTLRNNGFGGILADEMGLGKTLEVITFLVSEAEENPKEKHIVICPASLVFNWKNEFERFAPNLKTVIVAGNAPERADIISKTEPGDILITSYDLLKRDIECYNEMSFGCEIIDEAQYIKNTTTQSSKSVKSLRSDFRLALTGTPVENRLSELWSIFDFLMPGFLHTYSAFRDEFEIPIVQFKSKEDMDHLQKMIKPFILRRLKSEVLKDLPDKIEEPITTVLEGEQMKLYAADAARLRNQVTMKSAEDLKNGRIQILAELMRLRQLCCDPALLYDDYNGGSAKAELCIDMIKQAIDGGHKILLFSQFTSMLDILQKRLDEEEIAYYSLIGSTPKDKRIKMTEAFNANDVPVFCISLKAGGTGLNLTAADIVIHFDPWWNVAVQNQATDRAHRIGQKNVVTVYKLIAKGTIEENILRLQEKKRQLADDILSGEEFGGSSFTKEELLELLS